MNKSDTTNLLIEDILKDIIISKKRCDICKKSVLINQRNNAYHCKKFDKWTHNKCDDPTDYESRKFHKDECLKCSTSFLLYNMPFTVKSRKKFEYFPH